MVQFRDSRWSMLLRWTFGARRFIGCGGWIGFSPSESAALLQTLEGTRCLDVPLSTPPSHKQPRQQSPNSEKHDEERLFSTDSSPHGLRAGADCPGNHRHSTAGDIHIVAVSHVDPPAAGQPESVTAADLATPVDLRAHPTSTWKLHHKLDPGDPCHSILDGLVCDHGATVYLFCLRKIDGQREVATVFTGLLPVQAGHGW